ncbi:hypothetical protein GOL39_32180 [Sinorhizobium medicae]|nr:hypothetical protein [Sinorhizobium medicae]
MLHMTRNMAKRRVKVQPEKSAGLWSWSGVGNVLATVLSIVTVLGLVVGFLDYVLGVSIIRNPSEQYRASYDALVTPLVLASYEVNEDETYKARIAAAMADTPAARAEIVADEFRKYLTETNQFGKIEPAVRHIERIINCQDSLGCKIDSYDAYRKDFIQFWYSYRGTIEKMRGNGNSNFGSTLENEARRMYQEDLLIGDPS